MAERLPLPNKPRAIPVAKVTTKEQARQFSSDFYENGGTLFCRFCEHSLDFVRINTIKDHLVSQKHNRNKDKKEAGSSQPVQHTLTKSKYLREECILDFIKMCTVADIPLEKADKMVPFLKLFLFY